MGQHVVKPRAARWIPGYLDRSGRYRVLLVELLGLSPQFPKARCVEAPGLLHVRGERYNLGVMLNVTTARFHDARRAERQLG